MRFTRIFAFALSAFTAVNAIPTTNQPVVRAPSLTGDYSPVSRSELVSRQQGVTANICATVGPLSVSALGLNIKIVDQICLCTQAGVLTPQSVASLSAALTVAQNGGLLSPILGVAGNTLASLLQQLIGQATPLVNARPQCANQVPNSVPICVAGAAPTACGFTCNTGFKTCGTTCIANTASCVSGIPVKRRSQEALRICPFNWASCPVKSGKTIIYECVDTTNDLESCGGCAGIEGQGVDCTAITGVNDISCVSGICQASSCLRGFVLNGTSCVARALAPRRTVIA